MEQQRHAIDEQRRSLPVFQAGHKIVAKVRQHPTTIIVGETGSGKTTQIPQFLHKAGLSHDGAIAITQPRRVAAITLAKRVAEETGTKLGQLVGYSIRFDDCTSQATCIKYLTDGMLLRELLSDELLMRYSVVILDEAHERTVRTDILFGLIKSIQTKRASTNRPLKLVVMSATLEADRFSSFFDNAPVLYVAGRQFPVQQYYMEETPVDYVDAALVTILQLHREEPLPGDMLVFLTGQEEIENMERLLLDIMSELPPETPKMIICPLFAALPPTMQVRVFEPTPRGTRKIVLATNVAETSITINGITHVIDCGFAKERSLNSRTGMETLKVHPISKAAARQRSGRAGREAPGNSYRLYSEDTFYKLNESPVPEIQRCGLGSVALMLKANKVQDVLNFDYIDRPPRDAVVSALHDLFALHAIDANGALTAMGTRMADFPIEPRYARAILSSAQWQCTEEIVSLIALLSVDTVFFSGRDEREKAESVKKKFISSQGDHWTLLNVLRSYLDVKRDGSWCKANFVNSRAMKEVMRVRDQLVSFCERYSIPHVSCGDSRDRVLKCILTGFFRNTATRQHDGSYKVHETQEVAHIHPSSVLIRAKPNVIMFDELVLTNKAYVRCVSFIDSAWLPEVAPHWFGANKARKAT